MRSLYFILIMGLILILPTHVIAAPFCIERTDQILECQFYDPIRCVREGAKTNKLCRMNPDRPPLVQGDKDFCLAHKSQIVECIYQNAQPCNDAAARKKIACLPKIKD